MRLRSSEAASKSRVSDGVMRWLSILIVLLTSGCTEPTFSSEPRDTPDSGDPSQREGDDAGTAESDDAGTADTGAEPPDNGSESRDGAAQPASTEGCDGGACPAVDAQMSSTTPEAGVPDTGGDPVPVLDEERAKWTGLYAARSAMFGIDAAANGTIRVLSLIEIVATPEGGLRLEEELCHYAAEWQLGFSGTVNNSYGETRSSAALRYGPEGFSTERLLLRAGYGEAPAGCSAGANVQRQAHQQWLTDDTCECPRSNDIPTSVRDCRLTDPEKDGQPGASLSATAIATQYVFRVAQELRTSLIDGYRHGDRLYADRWFEEATNLLNCTINGQPAANSRCPVTPYRSCPSRHNKVEMVKVEEPTKCAQVIARESALFLSPLPSFPAICASELAAAPKP